MSSLASSQTLDIPILPLSDMVIPSVPGEFYVYPGNFTKKRPLYALMKCKSNKDRPAELARELGHEANFLFLFDSLVCPEIISAQKAGIAGLLGDSVNGDSFDEAWIAHANITEEDFHSICSEKNVDKLMEICQESCQKREGHLILHSGAIVAVMTNHGKFGLFIIREINRGSIRIDACHILV